MKELSLNILDIAENSVKARATLTEILLTETDDQLELVIRDDGCGMTEEVVRGVTDPFYTTRTTRKVGLGLPLLKLEAEMTGGSMEVLSKAQAEHPADHGTVVTARFVTSHIDCPPLGDVVETMVTLVQGHPDTDFYFSHKTEEREVAMDTRELRAVLEDVPLNSYEVLQWIEAFLREQYQ